MSEASIPTSRSFEMMSVRRKRLRLWNQRISSSRREPGKPSEAGRCEEIIEYFKGRVPILGVCLGHQAICEVFGATVSYAKELMHGKMSVVNLAKGCKLFEGLGETAEVARYHSLIAVKDTIPECLEVTATTEDGEIMAVKHRDYDIYGLQFHPESILTPQGKTMLLNFLK